MSHRSRFHYRLSLLAVAPLLVCACRSDSAVAPELVNPELRELRIERSAIRPGGALVVYATLADPAVVLSARDRIAVTVSSSGGESEDLSLKRHVCQLANGTRYVCDMFVLGLQGGDHAEQLLPLLEQISARYTWVASDGRAAAVRVLEGNLEDAMRAAEAWPGVRWVEPNLIATLAGGPPPAERMSGAALLEFRAEAARDGSVQLEPGATVTVQYRQPDGSILVTSLTP